MGTNLSALRCGKCEDGKGAILPDDPTADNPVWRCNVHKNIRMDWKYGAFRKSARSCEHVAKS